MTIVSAILAGMCFSAAYVVPKDSPLFFLSLFGSALFVTLARYL